MSGEEDTDTCARCGAELGGPRVIVLQGSLAIMFCTECGKKEAHRKPKPRSGTHVLDLDLEQPKTRPPRTRIR